MIKTELGALRRSHYSDELSPSMDGSEVTKLLSYGVINFWGKRIPCYHPYESRFVHNLFRIKFDGCFPKY